MPDAIESAFGELLEKVQAYGLAVVGLVVVGLLFWLGVKYIWRGLGHS